MTSPRPTAAELRKRVAVLKDVYGADCKFAPISQKNNGLEFGETPDISRTERECLDTPSPHLIACAFIIGLLFLVLFWGAVLAVLVF